jgi:rRNA-processing protein FCF1
MSLSQLVEARAKHGLLIDTNLLLLLLVGRHDRKRITSFKRTSQFEAQDFDLLLRFTARFRRFVTTPHVLTETTNLAGQLHGRARAAVLGELTAIASEFEERFTPAEALTKREMFARFGLTDTAIADEAGERYLVLTDDFALSQYLAHRGVAVINFNHLRFPTLR